MSRVLLIDTTLQQKFGLTDLSMYHRQGIGSISSVLKKYGHETALLVLTRLDTEKINTTIQKFKPHLIALSSTTGTIKIAETIINFIHHNYKTSIILGGIHATIMPEEAIKIKGLTAICIGEGEQPLLELANQIKQKKQNTTIKNLWYKKNGKIIKNPIRNLMPDLDKLPFADRTLFDNTHQKNGHAEISAGRGCPYNCTICVNHTLQKIYKNKGHFIRIRSVKNVIQEIQYLITLYKG